MILVVAIVVIISGFSYPFLTRYMLSNNLALTEDKLISSIRKAQINAMSGKDNEDWGVCIFNNEIRLYSNMCLEPHSFQDYSLFGSVEAIGDFDVTFSQRGEPLEIDSVTLRTRIDETIISINAVGGINAD